MNETPVGPEGKVHSLAPKVGYGLLLMSLAGYAEQFTSPHFDNALWKFQLVGALVDNTPMLLLALFLVFQAGPDSPPLFFERRLRPFLSWLCLILGIVFFVLAPVPGFLVFDIDTALETKAAAEVHKADQLEEQLKKAKPEERDEYLKHGNPTPEAMRAAAKGVLHHDRATIIVKCIKWSLGAVAAGAVFICIWNASRWARRKSRQRSYSKGYR